ncbi:MAG: hypothetical protein QXK41_04005 [Desulfurococcaceae archaeon]
MSFCINAGELKKGFIINALASLAVFNMLIALYVYFVLMLPSYVSLLYAILIGALAGVLLGYLSLDIVHVFLDSFLLITGGFSRGFGGFETCG